MGHNFGCLHDFDVRHGGTGHHQTSTNACTQNDNIMSYGKTREKWSTCSRKDVIAHYNSNFKYSDKWCLESKLLRFIIDHWCCLSTIDYFCNTSRLNMSKRLWTETRQVGAKNSTQKSS